MCEAESLKGFKDSVMALCLACELPTPHPDWLCDTCAEQHDEDAE